MSVKVTGSGQAVIQIKQMRVRLANMTPMWEKVGSYLAMVNRRQFATEGAYGGKPWKPLKPEYLQWKVRNGYRRKTLVQTGAMRASFTSRPMSIEVYKGNSATFGSSNALAGYHQHGTHRNGKRAIPARPIVFKNAKLTQGIRDVIADYILNKSHSVVRKYM